MSATKSEHVLVVPAELIHGLGYFQGFTADAAKYLPVLTDPAHASYRARSAVEQDPTYKQLIPYVILRAGGALFQYTRARHGGEKRLHRLRSIGIGGHISRDDRSLFDAPYDQAMHREVAEEVEIAARHTDRCVGLINDDETPVGRVHLGIVHLWDLERPDVRPRERALARAGFEPIAALAAAVDEFETWSQICLRALFAEAFG